MRYRHELLWVALLLTLPCAVEAKTLGDRALVRAIYEAERGNEEQAVELFEQALAQPRPGSPYSEARFLAAHAALRGGDPEAALRFSDALTGSLAEVGDFVLSIRARAYRQLSNWHEARAAWTQLLEGYPDSPLAPDAYFGRADALYAGGQLESAKRAYEHALRYSSKGARASFARFNVARLHEALGEMREASSDYESIVYYRPTDPLSDEAEARLNALVQSGRARPATFKRRLSRIDRLLSARHLEHAERLLNELEVEATSNSRRTSIKYRKAQLAYKKREFDTASQLFSELAAASRGWRQQSYREWVARCFSAADDNERAINAYLELAESETSSRTARSSQFKAAWLAYNSRDYARALEMFGTFAKRYPSDSSIDEIYWYMGWNAYRLADFPTALDTLGKIIREHPSSSLVIRAHYWRGRILTSIGNTSAARQEYEQSLSLEPLSYYGALSHQRLRELDREEQRLVTGSRSLMLAALGAAGSYFVPETRARLEPGRDELPEDGGVRPSLDVQLPWGGSVLDWNNAKGRRALRLIKLGLRGFAAEIVRDLPELPGLDDDTIVYGRARLLYQLGDYGTAYRLASSVFRHELEGRPSPTTRRFYLLAYPVAFGDLVQHAAEEFGVSPLLLLAIMRQESAFAVRARSWASAQGLMQIIPPTGRKIAEALRVEPFNPEMLNTPEVNVRFGAWYMDALVEKYHGHPVLALASYNAGPKAVTRWLDAAHELTTDEFVEEIPYRETRHYVKRVLGNLAAYHALHGQRALRLPTSLPDTYLDNVNF